MVAPRRVHGVVIVLVAGPVIARSGRVFQVHHFAGAPADDRVARHCSLPPGMHVQHQRAADDIVVRESQRSVQHLRWRPPEPHVRRVHARAEVGHVVDADAPIRRLEPPHQDVGTARIPGEEAVVEADVPVGADVVEHPPTGVRIGMDAVPVLVEQDVVTQHQRPCVTSYVQRVPTAPPPNRPSVVVDDAAIDLDV